MRLGLEGSDKALRRHQSHSQSENECGGNANCCEPAEVMLDGICSRYSKTVNVFVYGCVGWGLHHLCIRPVRLASWEMAGWD